MICLLGRILQGGRDIFPLKEGVVFDDFFRRGSRTEQLKNVADPNPEAAQTRAPTAFTFVYSDPRQAFG